MRYLGLAIAVAIAAGPAAQAATIFSNPGVTDGGNCSFNDRCAQIAGLGNFYAAEAFTLSASATVRSASFEVLTRLPGPIESVKWRIYDANGSGGLPGTLVSSGVSLIYQTDDLGITPDPYAYLRQFYSITPTTLAAGSYYIAFQGHSHNFDNYLRVGAAASGGAHSSDGGVTWGANYTPTIPSVAVALYDTGPALPAPEPASWALMIAGFGLTGAALRRRRPLTAG